jgi:hypothetical protein
VLLLRNGLLGWLATGVPMGLVAGQQQSKTNRERVQERALRKEEHNSKGGVYNCVTLGYDPLWHVRWKW